MKKLKTFLETNKLFFEIAWKSHKSYFFIYIITTLYGFISNMLLIYLPKMSLNAFLYKEDLWLGVGYICGYILIISVWAYVERRLTLKQSMNTQYISVELREHIYRKMNENSMLAFEDSSEYDALQKALNYTYVGADEVINILSQMITCILTLIGVSYIVGQVSVIIVIIIFATLILSHLCMNKVNDLWFKYQNTERLPKVRLLQYLQRLFNEKDYVSTVKLNEAFDYSIETVNEKGMAIAIEGNKKDRQRFRWNYLAIILGNVQLLSAYLYFGYMLFAGLLDVATYSALFVAVQQFTQNFNSFLGLFINLKNNVNEASFYMDYIKDEKYVQNGTEKIDNCEEIALENVSFKYPNQGQNALNDVSFSIKAGSRIAIVGENGAGKTTLLKLILALYPPTSGKILINGETDINDVDLSSWYKQLSVVLQNSVNIPLTLEENIAFRGEKDIDSGKIEDSIRFSGLEEKIDSLPKKEKSVFSTRFDKEGVDFSGGEKQKISIARAYYRDANILVFDEPSSALDPNAEYEFFKKIYELGRDKTVIFVSHRLSTVVKADQIIVIDKGQVAEMGTHDELMARNGLYCEMFTKQAENYIAE
ncbi:MAG: ABC transporter ATP-binding protein/permease [Oscillospiraceae bacterium]|nr:ABC transporter ATP-binding protein/permease [Oscillospiraceae bacterium]